MNQKVLTLLERARTLISNPDNWLKNSLWNEDRTCFCAMGAISTARNALPGLKADTKPDMMAAEEALDARAPGANYIRFNDLPTTTHADILRLFDEAIADVRKKLQPVASALPKASEPEPTPTPQPLPATEQLRALDEALKALQKAQGLLLDANSHLADAETEEFSVSVTTDPALFQAAHDAIQKRIDDLMPKFKAGDRVRITESQHPANIGALMTILGPTEGPVAGWYNAIADKPIMTVACQGDKFGDLHNKTDPVETREAKVFCTKVQKVDSVEDLINELVTGSDEVTLYHSISNGWSASHWEDGFHRKYATDPDLRTALTSLRDKVKGASK